MAQLGTCQFCACTVHPLENICDTCVENRYDPNSHRTSADHTMTRSERAHFEAVQRGPTYRRTV